MKNEVRKPHREKQREEAATQKVKAELKAALS